MNVPIRFKRFALWLATVIMLIAVIAYIVTLTVPGLGIRNESAINIAICSLIVIVLCAAFFLTTGARWEEELKKYDVVHLEDATKS